MKENMCLNGVCQCKKEINIMLKIIMETVNASNEFLK